MAKNGKAQVKKEADITAVPEVVRSVRCTRVRILFDMDLLLNGKKAADIDPVGSAIFEKDFQQTIDIGKMVESACAQVQQQMDAKR